MKVKLQLYFKFKKKKQITFLRIFIFDAQNGHHTHTDNNFIYYKNL